MDLFHHDICEKKEGEECMQKGMEKKKMTKYHVRITAVRQTVYHDLMAQYENPIEHTCDVRQGQQ